MTKQKPTKAKRGGKVEAKDGTTADLPYDTTGELPAPTEKRLASVAWSRERQAKRRLPVAIRNALDPKKPDTLSIGSPHADQQGFVEQLNEAFGTSSFAYTDHMLLKLMHSARQRGTSTATEGQLNAGLAFVESIAPTNELEAAIAVNMFATNEAAMDMLSRARHADLMPHVDSYVNAATKLQRTFVAQAEALAKLRRGGEQVVKVVYVDQRTQTVIGEQHNHDGRARESEVSPAVLAASGGVPIDLQPVAASRPEPGKT